LVQVVWTRGALADLRTIRAYIAQFSPGAAERLARRLASAAQSLERTPDRGRPAGRGRRELAIIPPYLIRYIHTDARVFIVEIRHGAREPD
jgi:plasmid stabilization system protein ParE